MALTHFDGQPSWQYAACCIRLLTYRRELSSSSLLFEGHGADLIDLEEDSTRVQINKWSARVGAPPPLASPHALRAYIRPRTVGLQAERSWIRTPPAPPATHRPSQPHLVIHLHRLTITVNQTK